MANKTNAPIYYTRMDNSGDDKRKMFQFIHDGDSVLDVGAGSGVVSSMLLQEFPSVKVTAIDQSTTALDRLHKIAEDYPGRLTVCGHDFYTHYNFLLPTKDRYDVIIFSAVLHEMFSYIPYQGTLFNSGIIGAAIKEAARLLKPNGRIIIRDGVAPSHNHRVLVQYLDDEMRELAELYKAQFKGFDLDVCSTQYGDEMPRRSAMELLYTITWGRESFAREVQEWYGYFSLEDWNNLALKLVFSEGLQLIHIEKYLQPGYVEHLKSRVKLSSLPKNGKDGTVKMTPSSWPASNCLVVFEKF